MKRYTIVEYLSFENTTLYSIIELSAKNNETDDFFLRFKDRSKYARDVEQIAHWIQKIGKIGVLERYFRLEKEAVAIPIDTSKLRLYGYRINDEILIIGNGGEKTSQKAKDSPDAYPHFVLMNKMIPILQLKINNGKLIIDRNCLKGDLSFYIK